MPEPFIPHLHEKYAAVLDLVRQGKGRVVIAEALGLKDWKCRRLVFEAKKQIEREQANSSFGDDANANSSLNKDVLASRSGVFGKRAEGSDPPPKWGSVTKPLESARSIEVLQQPDTPPSSLSEEELKPKVIALLRKTPSTVNEIAARLSQPVHRIASLCIQLKDEGINIHSFGGKLSIESAPPSADQRHATDDRFQLKADANGYFKFGVTSDNHLCSKYSRLDVLDDLYKRFADAGIMQVYNAGNWIDGEARFNKFDLLVHGMNPQVEYFLEHYPQYKSITTCFIAGDDHEGWYCQREGVDIGLYTEMKATQGGRNDLRYLGYMESYIDLVGANGNGSKLLVCHPGGGSSYAISYTSQKSVEAYDGGEKPAIALYGHYHKLNYSFIRNVHAIQTGCTEDQTPFMRKKKISAHIGGVIVEGWLDGKGAVVRCRPEFITYFDRKYYQNQWNMSGGITQNKI